MVTKVFPVVCVSPTSYCSDDVRLHVAPFSAASMLPFRGEFVLVQDPDSDRQGTGRVHRVSYAEREIRLEVVWSMERQHAH